MTTTDHIDLLERSYAILHAHYLTASKADFSLRWLGRHPSYLTSMRARTRHVSPEVLDFFYQQLERYMATFGKLINYPQSGNLQNKVEAVVDLLGQVGAHYAVEMMFGGNRENSHRA
jgi:hypothetical protein